MWHTNEKNTHERNHSILLQCHICVIPALSRLRQEDSELDAILDYIVKHCPQMSFLSKD